MQMRRQFKTKREDEEAMFIVGNGKYYEERGPEANR